MAVTVKAVLKNQNGVWFGWSGKVTDHPGSQPRILEVNKVTYGQIELSKTTSRNIATVSPIACSGPLSITVSTCRNIRALTRAAICASTACLRIT
jgi:hypothetical protein